MSWRVRYTCAARDDLLRLYGFALEQDMDAAQRAMDVIDQSLKLLHSFPFTCRKADLDSLFLRKLLVSCGAFGYVALYEIEENHTSTILAVRHQREDDYH